MLTPSELLHLKYAALGLTSLETSKLLFVSLHTVKNHRQSVIRKLHAKNVTHAVFLHYVMEPVNETICSGCNTHDVVTIKLQGE